MDWTFAVFAATAVISILFAISIFVFKDVIHVILSLILLFASISCLFVLLNQPLLAIIQLLVMVGGVATYFMIGSAPIGLANFRHTNFGLLTVLFVIIFAALAYPIINAPRNYPAYATFTGVGFSYGQPLFYLIALFLFGVSIGALMLFKKGDNR
jgi:NADH:ubiquinone oxidoreductase subunit 6 (subunit J)